MNRVERLTAVLLMLQEKARTSEEIATRFEVSRRTVLRDIEALCEMGVPVFSRSGAGGGYSLPESYRLAALPLTTQEAFLMLLALSAISRLPDAPFGGERASLVTKLRSLLTPQQLPQVERLLATVTMAVPERGQRSPHLDALIEAARERRWVQVVYESAERRSIQHLLPLQITTHNGFWYCSAFSYEHDEERTYRVDRMQLTAAPGEQFSTIRAAADRAALHKRREYHDAAHQRIVVALTTRGVELVESEQHLGQSILRNEDGTGRLDFRCPPGELDWYARYFASLGTEACVQVPQELRERIIELVERLLEQYKKPNGESGPSTPE